jgi:hypothetical protein
MPVCPIYYWTDFAVVKGQRSGLSTHFRTVPFAALISSMISTVNFLGDGER